MAPLDPSVMNTSCVPLRDQVRARRPPWSGGAEDVRHLLVGELHDVGARHHPVDTGHVAVARAGVQRLLRVEEAGAEVGVDHRHATGRLALLQRLVGRGGGLVDQGDAAEEGGVEAGRSSVGRSAGVSIRPAVFSS